MSGIVLTCGKPQRFNLQPLDAFHTHAHEVNSDFFVLEEFWDVYDEFQPHGHFPRKADFSHGRSPLFSEESKEIPCVGPAYDGFDTTTPLVDTFCRELFHYKLFHAPMTTNTHMDKN